MQHTPKIRMLDLDEHTIVVTVTPTGDVDIIAPGMCDGVTANVLRSIADQLDAAHPPYPCTPSAEHERPAEPLDAPGWLDQAGRVWTDGRGHAWDLSLGWRDAAGSEWWWAGVLDGRGAPLMRTAEALETQPLDVVRACWGPIVPTGGERW